MLFKVGLRDCLTDEVKLQVLNFFPERGVTFKDVFDLILHLGETSTELKLSLHAADPN